MSAHARLNGLRPMLETPDMEGTLSFWTGKLGFDCIARMDDDRGRALWLQVQRDGVYVMFSTHYHDDPDEDEDDHVAAMTGALYVDVDDVDALAAELGERGVPLLFGPEDMAHGMREIGVRDPNGYTILFGRPVH